MKTDSSFKLVAVILFLGVLVAFISPSQSVDSSASASADHAPATHQTE